MKAVGRRSSCHSRLRARLPQGVAGARGERSGPGRLRLAPAHRADQRRPQEPRLRFSCRARSHQSQSPRKLMAARRSRANAWRPLPSGQSAPKERLTRTGLHPLAVLDPRRPIRRASLFSPPRMRLVPDPAMWKRIHYFLFLSISGRPRISQAGFSFQARLIVVGDPRALEAATSASGAQAPRAAPFAVASAPGTSSQ